MKVKIKISYEWEEDLTEAWEEWKTDGYTVEEFKEKEIEWSHAIEELDGAADNHICYDYKRNLEVKWDE